MTVLTIYTARHYIRDMVAMARKANASGVSRMRRSHECATGKSFLVKGAKWQFEFARKCMSDARKANSEICQ